MVKLTKRRLSVVVLCCLLSLLFASVVRADFGPDHGSIRGIAFLDRNRNGVREEGEEGLGWVYFTVSQGDYSHTFYSEWRETDSAGNTYATGTYGPVLPTGGWNVQLHVPQGYVATTPVQHTVVVPGDNIVEYNMGLYPVAGVNAGGTASLPRSGFASLSLIHGVLLLLGAGTVVSLGVGLIARRRS